MRTEELLAPGVFGRGSPLSERIEMLLARGREFSPTGRELTATGVHCYCMMKKAGAGE